MSNLIQKVKEKYSLLENLLTNFWKSCIKSNLIFNLQLRNIKWKNPKAKPGCAYIPTEIEQLANVITHGIWIVPAVIAALKLIERSRTSSQYLVSWIYGGALTLLFSISTSFHCSCYSNRQSGLKNILHRCDRATIYVFIAASYFPWLQLANHTHSPLIFCMEWMIWLMAAFGIAYQQIFHERFKCLETCFYIIMGVGPASAIILAGLEFNGLNELKLGGLTYILGIAFFKSDGVIPMAHAIWHLFVVLAAGFHYYAILVYLYPPLDIIVHADI